MSSNCSNLTPTVVLGGFYGKVMTDSMNDKLIRTVRTEARSAIPVPLWKREALSRTYTATVKRSFRYTVIYTVPRTLFAVPLRNVRASAERSRTNELNPLANQLYVPIESARESAVRTESKICINCNRTS